MGQPRPNRRSSDRRRPCRAGGRPIASNEPSVCARNPSRWVARAMNTWAVVSASPSAWCGRWTGRPSERARPESPGGNRDSRGWVTASAKRGQALKTAQFHPHARGIDDRVPELRTEGRESGFEKTPLDLGDVRDDRPPGERLQQAVHDVLERRGFLQVHLTKTVDADRVPVRHSVGPHELIARVVEPDPAAADGHGGEGDDLVGGRIQPGQLEVDHAEGSLPPRRGGRREFRVPIRAQRTGVDRCHVYRREGRPPASERCTAATSRKASRR